MVFSWGRPGLWGRWSSPGVDLVFGEGWFQFRVNIAVDLFYTRSSRV